MMNRTVPIVLALACACSMQEASQELPGDTDDVELPGGKGDHILPADSVLVLSLNLTETNAVADFDSDDHCFFAHAINLADYYDDKGAAVMLLSVNTPQHLVDELRRLAEAGEMYDRIIVLGHGTGNGPMFCCGWKPQPGWDYPRREQLHPDNLEFFEDMGAKMGELVVPNGWIYVGACNPGQPTDLPGFDSYLDALSCVTGRTTLGTNTATACWDVEDRIKALEGTDPQFTPGLVQVNPCDVDNAGGPISCREPEVACGGLRDELPGVDNDWGPCTQTDGQCVDVTLEGACEQDTIANQCPGPAQIQCCPSA